MTHPRLAIYELRPDDYGLGPRFVAFFIGVGAFLPVHVVGHSEAEVREKAARFWATESAKAAADGVQAMRSPEALAKAAATRAARKAQKVAA